MKSEFSNVTSFFSEDPKSQVDEFFGAFATFMGDFEVREKITNRIINYHYSSESKERNTRN